MLIKNGKALIGKKFVNADVRISDTIDEIGDVCGIPDLDAKGCFIIPGLVDIHSHGAVGEDFSDGSEDLFKLSDYYARNGVTNFLATTMTLPIDVLGRAVKAIDNFKRDCGAKCEGIHLEGPFISKEKCGAQAAENIILPSVDVFNKLNEQSGKKIRLVTVAPEAEGCLDFIKHVSKICAVSIGHTVASYEIAKKAFDCGASHVTHLFNAMPPLLHRAPGVVGAALDSGASVELICDGLHVHPSVIRIAFSLFKDKVNIISDSLRCAQMPDGNYELGGQPIVVKGGKATLLDGTLAGSTVSLIDEVKNVVSYGVSLADAVYAASTAPARAARLRTGEIKVGYSADIVILDSELNIKKVFIDGKEFPYMINK